MQKEKNSLRAPLVMRSVEELNGENQGVYAALS